MSQPLLSAMLAEAHRRDRVAEAQHQRLVRAVRPGRPWRTRVRLGLPARAARPPVPVPGSARPAPVTTPVYVPAEG